MAIAAGSVLTAADLKPITVQNLASENLDTITTMGLYFQGTNATATLALNYPVANVGGLLEVYGTTQRWFQRLTGHPSAGANAGKVWSRAGGTSLSWTSWVALA